MVSTQPFTFSLGNKRYSSRQRGWKRAYSPHPYNRGLGLWSGVHMTLATGALDSTETKRMQETM